MRKLNDRLKKYLKKYNGKLYAEIRGYDHDALYVGRFEAMKKYIRPEAKTVLDIGAHFGEMSLEFAEIGKKVTAVEKSTSKISCLREYCRKHGNKFNVVHEDIFDYTQKHRDFDTVLALNIFHHFTRTEDGFKKLTVMLRRLRITDMFFLPATTEELMEEGSVVSTKNAFVEWVMSQSGMTKKILVGTFNKRNLYYFQR